MGNRLINFETAKLAKEKGYKSGTKNVFIKYHSTYEYDGDPNHWESHVEGDVISDSTSYMINGEGNPGDLSNEYYTLYERPSLSEIQEWLYVESQIWAESRPLFSANEQIGVHLSITSWKFPQILIEEDDEFDVYKGFEKVLLESLKLINKNKL